MSSLFLCIVNLFRAIFVLLEIEKNVKFGKKIDYGNSRKLTYKFYRIRVRQYKSFQLIDSVKLK